MKPVADNYSDESVCLLPQDGKKLCYFARLFVTQMLQSLSDARNVVRPLSDAWSSIYSSSGNARTGRQNRHDEYRRHGGS